MDYFNNYLHAQARREAAYQHYNAASCRLELETILERLAEIKSQHEPLASLVDGHLTDRDAAFAAAYYVVVGRIPENNSLHPSGSA